MVGSLMRDWDDEMKPMVMSYRGPQYERLMRDWDDERIVLGVQLALPDGAKTLGLWREGDTVFVAGALDEWLEEPNREC